MLSCNAESDMPCAAYYIVPNVRCSIITNGEKYFLNLIAHVYDPEQSLKQLSVQ